MARASRDMSFCHGVSSCHFQIKFSFVRTVKKSANMDEVITFDKSLQQRLREYKDIFAGYETLPVSAIEKEWSFYLELVLDPNGWQAIWKMQRKTCESLAIPFPSVVLVYVETVDFKDLTAQARVVAVQDDIHIPEVHWVPLVQLWPTKGQDKSVALNLEATANALDLLRFFYNNLLMPWDYDDDDTVDWRSKNLEPRLRLYYDMKNGSLPRVTAEHLHSLITEAKRLQVKREALEGEIGNSGDFDHDVNNDKLQTLMELHIRMMEIKGEVDILENPLLRGALVKRHKEVSSARDDEKESTWVVYGEGTANDCIQFLSKIETLYPNETLKFSPQLVSALECANSKDTVILSERRHLIKSTGALEYGGTLKGISTPDKTLLATDSEDVMLDFKGEDAVIENVTIEATASQCAIVVRGGRVTLNHCKLIGDGKSSTHQGVIVLSGGRIELVDCDISNFSTAIVGNSGSSIAIESSEFHDCNFGLKIYDNCSLRAVKATIRNCRDYGICVETENNWHGTEPKIGNFDTLNIIPKLQMEFTRGNNNVKGDAIINQKCKLRAVDDLFDNPDSEPTVCIESDEEMDFHQTTVIENGRDDGSPATV